MRTRTLTLILLCLLAVAAAAVLPSGATAKQFSTHYLKLRLHSAHHQLRVSRAHVRRASARAAAGRALQATLAAAPAVDPSTPDAASTAAVTLPPGMDATLAARLLGDGVVTDAEIDALDRRVATSQAAVRRWVKRVHALAKRVRERVRIERWAKHGAWKPLIRIAARRYGISARGLHHMMILESGGSRTAGTMFKGLFQYLPSTWAASWNHWRRHSIFDGWAQIQATAYAISRGMGPSQWPNTYPMSF